jgi:hypothetical protein
MKDALMNPVSMALDVLEVASSTYDTILAPRFPVTPPV